MSGSTPDFRRGVVRLAWRWASTWLLAAAFAGILPAQDTEAGRILFARIQAHITEELTHLPNYTCLQTIARYRKSGVKQTALEPLDQVRLEVVYNDRQEWYGSPGDRSFTLSNPVGFIGGGMISTGAFGIEVHNIFVSRAAIVTYDGEEQEAGRSVVRYRFQLPALLRVMEVAVLGGSGTVGEEGMFWVDKQSLDLVRVESHVIEIPIYLPLDSMDSRVVFGRTRIGEHDVLLPQHAELHVAEPGGLENFNRSDFTHCRAFHVNSEVRFEAPDEVTQPPTAANPKVLNGAGDGVEAVPALLKVTVELAKPIATTDSVGTLITGRIVGNVTRKSKLVLADGAEVRGRIRRLERYQGGDTYIVGLEFLSVETATGPLRFYADLLSIDPRAGIKTVLGEPVAVPGRTQKTAAVTIHELPGVASFFVTPPATAVPAGLRMVWRTRGLLR